MTTILFDPRDQQYLVVESFNDEITGVSSVIWINDYSIEYFDIEPYIYNKPLSEVLTNHPNWLQLEYKVPFNVHYPELLV